MPPPQGRRSLRAHQRHPHHRVVDVCCAEHYRQRDAPSVRSKVALGALSFLYLSDSLRFCAPLLAGMQAESSEARSQSIWSASPRRSRRTRCNLSHTPPSCHSLRRRQLLIPEPHATSWGSISQAMPPLFSTKTIPVKAARSSLCGLPPWGFGGSGGRSGSIVSHSSSVTSSLAKFSSYPVGSFVRLTKCTAASFIAITNAIASREEGQSVVWLCLVVLPTQSCILADLLAQLPVSPGIPETSTSTM